MPNSILIIRAAAGLTAQYKAGDLLAMYLRLLALQGRKSGIIELQPGDDMTTNCIREVLVEIEGGGFAVGGPGLEGVDCEVFPETNDIWGMVNLDDLRTESFHCSSVGGLREGVAIRIKHLPTGIVAESTSGRTKGENRAIAIQALLAKIRFASMRKQE